MRWPDREVQEVVNESKIRVNSPTYERYLDELPLNWREEDVDNAKRRLNKKAFREE